MEKYEREWGKVYPSKNLPPDTSGVTIQLPNGAFITPEQLAEQLIAECQQQLQVFELAAGMGGPAAGFALAAESNLHFMQWWLQNRREKRRGANP